jgi:hypothetical protein
MTERKLGGGRREGRSMMLQLAPPEPSVAYRNPHCQEGQQEEREYCDIFRVLIAGAVIAHKRMHDKR